mmetsp:Transcript_3426/g.10487  ORF Transcript_3426/g.10487 Transcript_3426/m.10487 type:complete len:500 (+) Transcript_3426:66-1565(+)
MMLSLLLLASAFVIKDAEAAVAADLVTSLPGFDGELPVTMYSGFLTAGPTKKLHYVFVESQNDNATDPIAMWFNGGPGCSSLDGFLYEHGPFRFEEFDGTGTPTLGTFFHSWTKLANMVYIEAPVGVGFSYSSATDPTQDYQCDDDQTAYDNLMAVQDFFAKYPEYKQNKFYLTGESYAGIYVPTLAEAIIQAELAVNYTGAALAGIAVGNGCTGDEIGICAFGASTQGDYYTTKYLMQTAFAPDSIKDGIRESCDLDGWSQGGKITAQCAAVVAKLNALTSPLDTYCVYCDCGQQFPADDLSREQMRLPENKKMTSSSSSKTLAEIASSKHSSNAQSKVGTGTTACIDSQAASAWLNTPEVQAALHVTEAGVSNWATCSPAPGWTYTSTRPNLPRDTYPLLVANIRVLIYNGDWDVCVPYTDNEAWTTGMGYNVSHAWHSWISEVNGFRSVGGYATTFKVPGPSFQFTTVRGGRHEVPETAPERAFTMMQAFFSQTEL